MEEVTYLIVFLLIIIVVQSSVIILGAMGKSKSIILYRHVKSQRVYRLLHVGLYEADPQRRMAVYQSDIDPTEIWVRDASLFFDGRFEEMKNGRP